MAAPAGSAEELDEDAGREEGLPTPGGEWDEGEKGPGGRGELEGENGVGEERRILARAEVQGSQPRGQQPRHWRWGCRGEEPRGSHRPEGMGRESRSSVRSETSMIELWKATRS